MQSPIRELHLDHASSTSPTTKSSTEPGCWSSLTALRTKTMNLATGVVTTPTVKGTAFASSAKGTFTFVNNRLQFSNGTDMKWFDGTYWRDIGMRAPTSGEAAGVSTSVAGTSAPGIAASSVGGANPGYQLYMAYYNPTTGDVSNAVAIGSRLVPTSQKDFTITGLPDLSGVDSEWVKLIGRTGDGAAVAYACKDTSGNWITVANATTSATLTVADTDGNAELPTRNDKPPCISENGSGRRLRLRKSGKLSDDL
jgi:hypothetical protein